MEIRPPVPGTSMPILPASSQDTLITQEGSAQLIKIIPSTAFPLMNNPTGVQVLTTRNGSTLESIRSNPMSSSQFWHLLAWQTGPNIQEKRQNYYTRLLSSEFVKFKE
ncbi:MAG: hypothetical protein NPIRA06_05650 [Nitrospirales bacterium]|nr:MAG: hypothetical protein NPIRA06_05650 [Nitrospirales bacterium]